MRFDGGEPFEEMLLDPAKLEHENRRGVFDRNEHNHAIGFVCGELADAKIGLLWLFVEVREEDLRMKVRLKLQHGMDSRV